MEAQLSASRNHIADCNWGSWIFFNTSKIVLAIPLDGGDRQVVHAGHKSETVISVICHALSEKEAIVTCISRLEQRTTVYLYICQRSYSPMTPTFQSNLLTTKLVPPAITACSWCDINSNLPAKQGIAVELDRTLSELITNHLVCMYGGRQLFVFLVRLFPDRTKIELQLLDSTSTQDFALQSDINLCSWLTPQTASFVSIVRASLLVATRGTLHNYTFSLALTSKTSLTQVTAAPSTPVSRSVHALLLPGLAVLAVVAVHPEHKPSGNCNSCVDVEVSCEEGNLLTPNDPDIKAKTTGSSDDETSGCNIFINYCNCFERKISTRTSTAYHISPTSFFTFRPLSLYLSLSLSFSLCFYFCFLSHIFSLSCSLFLFTFSRYIFFLSFALPLFQVGKNGKFWWFAHRSCSCQTAPFEGYACSICLNFQHRW